MTSMILMILAYPAKLTKNGAKYKWNGLATVEIVDTSYLSLSKVAKKLSDTIRKRESYPCQ